MAGDASKELEGPTALFADGIQSLDAGGFTVGANDHVNNSGKSYHSYFPHVADVKFWEFREAARPGAIGRASF